MLGIIAIPGMMTGALLGGASVQQAAKLQMIIMFMIVASTTLASVFTALAAVFIVVDEEHRVRGERIFGRSAGLFKFSKNWSAKNAIAWVKKKAASRPPLPPAKEEEQERLLMHTLS